MNWHRFLEEDYEDEYKVVEKIIHPPRRKTDDDDKKTGSRKKRPKDTDAQ
jgi:hypothetical protein